MNTDPRKAIEVKVFQTLKGHSHFVYTSVYFEKKKILVTGSWDKTVKYWDCERGICIGTSKAHSFEIFRLLKWNDDIFLSCSDDGSCKVHSLESKSCTRTIFGNDSMRVFDMARVEGDILFTIYSPDRFVLFNFSDGKKLKDVSMKETRFEYYSEIKPSLTRKNHFFITGRKLGQFKLDVDQLTFQCVRKFYSSIDYSFYSMSVYQNKMNEEIIAVGGRRDSNSDYHSIFLYNTSKSDDMPCHRLSNTSSTKCVKVFNTGNNFYLFAGSSDGVFEIYDLKDEERVSLVKSAEICKGKDIVDIQILDHSIERNEVVLSFCSYDHHIHHVSVKNILSDDLEHKDLMERVDYLTNEYLMNLSGRDEEKMICTSKTCNESIRFFKTFV